MSTLARTTRALVLATAAGAALAGCGDGDQGGGAAPVSPTVTVTETATATATETATVTATTTATVSARPGDAPGTRDCGQVGFEPGTDAGAFDIRASGVGCQVAREVARGAEGERGARYTATKGFECRPTGTVGELPSVVYECSREESGAMVRFEAS